MISIGCLTVWLSWGRIRAVRFGETLGEKLPLGPPQQAKSA